MSWDSLEKIVQADDELELVLRDVGRTKIATVKMNKSNVLIVKKKKNSYNLSVSINYIQSDEEKKRIADKYGLRISNGNYWGKEVSNLDNKDILEIIMEMKEIINEDLVKDMDSRVITFNEDLVSGGLVSLADIVRGDDELELCYRGNSGKGNITIYMHNHMVLKIEKYNDNSGYKFSVSINHAETDDEKNKLAQDYGLKITNDGYYWKKDSEVNDAETKELIADIKKMIEKYFINTMNFLNGKKATGTKKFPIEAEKVRQQELFSLKEMQETNNGYFMYDLEFARPYKDRAAADIAKLAGEKNKPDFSALKFEGGKASTLVIGEVKTMKNSCEAGTANMLEHLEKMISVVNPVGIDNKKFLKDRMIEAVGLFNSYKDAGLRGLDPKGNYNIDIKKFEIMLVFTDETINFAQKYKQTAQKLINSSGSSVDYVISVWTYDGKQLNEI